MKNNLENMETSMENIIYEKPSFKKYGTMKKLTLAVQGSLVQSNSQDPDQTSAGDFVAGDDTPTTGGSGFAVNATDITSLNNNPLDVN